MKRAIAIGTVSFAAIVLASCNSASESRPTSSSATCVEFCTSLENLAANHCIRPDVHDCASILTDKVHMASKVDTAIESEELSDTVEYIHTKIQLISTLGSVLGTSKCYDKGAKLGNRSIECRATAKNIDDRFAELVKLVQQLPS